MFDDFDFESFIEDAMDSEIGCDEQNTDEPCNIDEDCLSQCFDHETLSKGSEEAIILESPGTIIWGSMISGLAFEEVINSRSRIKKLKKPKE